MNIRILEANAMAQKDLVDRIDQQIQAQMGVLATNERSVRTRSQGLADSEQQQGIFNTVKRIFDPIGITGGADTGAVDAAQAMVDYAKEALRSSRARAGAAAGAAGRGHHRAAVGGGQAVERGQGALRPRRRDRPSAHPRQGEHALLHAGRSGGRSRRTSGSSGCTTSTYRSSRPSRHGVRRHAAKPTGGRAAGTERCSARTTCRVHPADAGR